MRLVVSKEATLVNPAPSITSDMTLDALLEERPFVRAVLVKHFGAGILTPRNMWAHEPLQTACRIRGVDLAELLADLTAAGGAGSL